MALDSLGVCTFAMYQRFDAGLWTDLYRALTGMELTPRELLRGGERAVAVRRLFNLREGASRRDDRPPARFVREALPAAGGERPPLDPARVDQLLDDYYDERGWAPDGSIRPETLRALGLDGG
ncbi:MAG: hypothetical protein Kow0092_29930 [Deferrisomatales bacterium]